MDKNLFSCPLCGSDDFPNSTRVNKHLQTCTGTKSQPIVCSYCKLRFATRKTLLHHEYQHKPRKSTPKPCPHCGRLLRKGGLQLHLRVCGPGKHIPKARTFSCHLCGSSNFTSPAALSSHLQTCTGTNSQPIVCPHCSRVLAKKSALGTHLRVCDNGAPVASKITFECQGCGGTLIGPKAYHEHQKDTSLPCCPEYIAPAILQPMDVVVSSVAVDVRKNALLRASVKADGGTLTSNHAGPLVPPGLERTLDEVLYRTHMCAETSAGITELRAYLGEGAAHLLLALTLDIPLVEQCKAATRADDFRDIPKITPTECELAASDHAGDWILSLSLIMGANKSEYVRLCVDQSQSTLAQSAWHHEVQRISFPDDSLWYNVWNGNAFYCQVYFIQLGKISQRWFNNSHACKAWANILKEMLCVHLQTYQHFSMADYDSAVVASPWGLNMPTSQFERLLHIDGIDATNLTSSEDLEKQAYGFKLYQNNAAGRYQASESFIALVRKRLVRRANPHLGDPASVRLQCARCLNIRTDYEPFYEDHTGFYVMQSMICRYCAMDSKSRMPETPSKEPMHGLKGTVSKETLLQRIQRKYQRTYQ